MIRLLIVIFCATFLVTCTHRWVAIPQNVKSFEKCDPLSGGAQMLKVPQFEKSYIIVYDCAMVDRQRVSIAMTMFLKEWKETFPFKITDNRRIEISLNSLVTEFSNAKKTANAYSVGGSYGRNLSLAGLTLSPGWAWVKIEPGERICNTSFIHELVHVAIWSAKGTDGDPDHLGSKYTGWETEHMLIIQNVNQQLCEWGI